MGVVIFLVILIIIGGVVSAVCYVGKKRRDNHTLVEHLQDVVRETNGVDTSTKLDSPDYNVISNNNYHKTQFDIKARSQSSPAATGGVTITGGGAYYSKLEEGTKGATKHELRPAVDEAGYSDVDILVNDTATSATYDDVVHTDTGDGEYSTVADCIVDKKHPPLKMQGLTSSPSNTHKENPKTYSLVARESPLVPKKTPELYKDLEVGSAGSEGEPLGDEHYSVVDENLKKKLVGESPAYVNKDGEEKTGGDEVEEDPAYYTTIKEEENATPIAPPTGGTGDYSEIERNEEVEGVYSMVNDSEESKIVPTSDEGMEVNPMYESANLVIAALEPNTSDADEIYSNPDACKDEDGDIYDTVYSESIRPSMFVKSPDRGKEEVGENHSTEEQEEEEVEAIYAPIYSLTASMESSGTVLQFKPENIHKIKTLGTGYFGKVLLADTVGLSLKELKMNETDDDKRKSVRVAVKTLKLNPSENRRETFDKELKFMSRLNHPNVVRTLGACMVDTPFIVMEYMEKGDLNGYLQDFDTIEQGNAPPTDLTISVGTLVSMSAQIADAMKYLASRNYIHRDLATRNCLVGPESRIKIADFGMSKNLYESHYYIVKGHAILPVRWMAKECFYGKFSAKTDVWAFGVTMWEIFTLTKDIPYEDMDDSEVAADASKRDGNRQLLQRSKYCPPEVYNVMLLCWKGEPSNRATFETLHETLLSLLEV